MTPSGTSWQGWGTAMCHALLLGGYEFVLGLLWATTMRMMLRMEGVSFA